MIFSQIELQNFRQYKNTVRLNFDSSKEDKNITLVIAANGVGKTTLVQAFKYCLYGQKSAYFDLPNREELVNNTIVKEMQELDTCQMRITVAFSHNNIKYIAERKQDFIKRNGKLQLSGSEIFDLKHSTEYDGYKTYLPSDAEDKIQSILPDGLSQVFMFDGERIQRNFADKKFGEELKESILGILDIKKFDKLIRVLGHESKGSSVLGMLNKRIKATTPKEQKQIDNYNTWLRNQNQVQEELDMYNAEYDEVVKSLDEIKAIQSKLDENKNRINEREREKMLYEKAKEDLKKLASDYLNKSMIAITYNLLVRVKSDYEKFLLKNDENKEFYDFLHVNTLEDIISKRLCVCGRPIEEHSKEEQRLISLKNSALPIESAQNLKLINEKFKRSTSLISYKEDLNKIKIEMTDLKIKIDEHRNNIDKISKEIEKTEEKYGIQDYQKYNILEKKKEQIVAKKGELNHRLGLIASGIKKSSEARNKIEQNDEGNKKVRQVIDIVKNIQDVLLKSKIAKEEKARNELAKNFDNIIAQTLQGSYRTSIDEKFKIQIYNSITNIDETSVLSTGQNIIVSLAFVNALIETAKNLSKVINKEEKYGVIMDAALSNLDEVHINRICNTNINTLDQLIFLSFKKQLRNEMYNGIKRNISDAYLLKKADLGYIEKIEIPLNQLDSFIHEYEEVENE